MTGLLLLSPALAAILYGLARVSQHGGFGSAAVLGPARAGLAAVGLFAVHAIRLRRRAASGPGAAREPVLDLGLLRSRSFTGSAVLMFVFGLSLYGAMLLLPLYYQQVRGASALVGRAAAGPAGPGHAAAPAGGRQADRPDRPAAGGAGRQRSSPCSAPCRSRWPAGTPARSG